MEASKRRKATLKESLTGMKTTSCETIQIHIQMIKSDKGTRRCEMQHDQRKTMRAVQNLWMVLLSICLTHWHLLQRRSDHEPAFIPIERVLWLYHRHRWPYPHLVHWTHIPVSVVPAVGLLADIMQCTQEPHLSWMPGLKWSFWSELAIAPSKNQTHSLFSVGLKSVLGWTFLVSVDCRTITLQQLWTESKSWITDDVWLDEFPVNFLITIHWPVSMRRFSDDSL